MRTSEWIQIGFAVMLAVAAWIEPLFFQPLPVRRRWNITLLAILAYEYWLQDRLTDVAPILVVYFVALQIGAIVVKYMKRAHVLEPAPAA